MALPVVSLVVFFAAAQTGVSWPGWRGPHGTGMADGAAPLTWDDSTNIRWRVPVPGRGHSTPVLAGDRLFLTTAIPTGAGRAPDRPGRAGGGADAGLEHDFVVMAIDRRTGQSLWRHTATTATPHEGYHRTYGSFASNSPVTDGRRVYAFFGSRGLYAYSVEGQPLWQKDFGVRMTMDMQFGEGTALTLHENRLLLHFDHLRGGFLTMLDPDDGREIWRTPRTERFNWAPPFVVEHEGRRQIVVNGLTVRGYDYDTGRLIWETEGLGENTIPHPVQHGDVVVVASGHTVRRIMGIRLGHTGQAPVVWSTERGAPYTPSPVIHAGRVFFVTDSGFVSSFDAATGTPQYQQERLPKPYNFKSSPVGAAGRLYLATEEGDVVVLRMGDRFEVLATNTLTDQSFIASPVIVDGAIYLRSQTHLYRIDEDR